MRFDSLTIRRDMPLTADSQITRMATGIRMRGCQQVPFVGKKHAIQIDRPMKMATPKVKEATAIDALYNWFMAPHTAKVWPMLTLHKERHAAGYKLGTSHAAQGFNALPWMGKGKPSYFYQGYLAGYEAFKAPVVIVDR